MTKQLIAIDAMGGDNGPEVTVPAACVFLKDHLNASVIMVGDQKQINAQLTHTPKSISDRIEIIHTTVVVTDNDEPKYALRYKKTSSMRLAINCVRNHGAHACVSAGNTGALMATARFVLKTIPFINRPAIISSFPTYDQEQGFRMLDLGANVDSTPETLVQFALMGSVVVTALDGIESPRVGLLNIGEEYHKGNNIIKETARRLADIHGINYVGYIEPNNIYKGQVDVVVCDGFLGNVALKSIEGTAKLIKHYISISYRSSWYGKVMAALSKPITNKMRYAISISRRNGATMIGLNGIVVKSHGSANIKGFANAIKNAYDEAKLAIPSQIADRVSALIDKRD